MELPSERLVVLKQSQRSLASPRELLLDWPQARLMPEPPVKVFPTFGRLDAVSQTQLRCLSTQNRLLPGSKVRGRFAPKGSLACKW
jgi:hypothetical protein